MKKIYVVVLLFSSLCMPLKAQDLTQFDYPFLIGDWYWFNANQSDSDESSSYKAISISFNSDYRFRVKLLKTDNQIEETTGSYDLDENSLVLNDDFGEPQQHQYQLNHNQLLLRGVKFTKLLPFNISGSWQSDWIQGQDVGDNVADIALKLRPDFIFSAEISGVNGASVTHRGVYFLEQDHLVLIYRGGQQDSVFHLEDDKLTLTNDEFGMHAQLTRHGQP